MIPPNEDDNTATASAAAHDEAPVPGATSDLAVASSSLHPGHASDGNDINKAADAGMDMEPSINNEAGATATGATLEPPATTTTIKADFTNVGGEDSTPKPKLVDDGEELSRPNHVKSTMVEVGQHLHEDNTTPPPAAMSGSGLEIIEDKDGPLLPPSMSAIPFEGDSRDHDAARTAASRSVGKPAKAWPEEILDDTRPALPISMMEVTDSKKMEPIVAKSPRLISIAEIGKEEDAMEKRQSPRRQIVREDSIVHPPSEDMEGDDLCIHTNRRGGRAEEYIVNANVAPLNPAVRRDEDEEANVQHSNPDDRLATPAFEQDSMVRVPEATLVEEVDDEVYMGTPVEPPVPPIPWWKQRRMKFILCLMFVIVAISAITSGISLSSEGAVVEPVVVVITSTNAPSISTFPSSFPSSYPTLVHSETPSTSAHPSVMPTGAPSVSIKPTSSPSDEPSPLPSSPPSACVNKIATNMHQIDLPIDDPQRPRVAIDGKNMVVVVREGDGSEGNPAYVIFHALYNDEWQRVNDPIPIEYLFDQDRYSVVLSGKTAFVGFAHANDYVGAVLVFEQNQFGSWENVDEPFIHVSAASHDWFGYTVGIDGDLAFVGDNNNVYMFRRGSNGKWVEFDMVDSFGLHHTISGHIIAVENEDIGHIQLYKYSPELDEIVPIQDPIRDWAVTATGLTNDYMVYWDRSLIDAFVYRKEETKQTFAFHQRLNIQRLNIPGAWFNRLALDSDILVVGGDSSTHIFSEQDGIWKETITLDRKYLYYAISGRQLAAATSSQVHVFDIQDCAQEMPTQTPTLLDPSSFTSPTETCYWITIAIDYDDKPEETSWSLYRDGGWVKSHVASAGDTSYSESICLEEGEYWFRIHDDWPGDGICCGHGKGSYKVTADGALIVQGAAFGQQDDIRFLLPFGPGTNV